MGCPEPWVGPFTTTGTLRVNGVVDTYTIVYYKRDSACGWMQDVQVSYVMIPPGSSAVRAAHYDPGAVLNEAIKWLMKTNAMGFGPLKKDQPQNPDDPPACVENYRVSAGTCWTDETNNEKIIIKPCVTSGPCCWTRYQVCLYYSGARIWTPLPDATDSYNWRLSCLSPFDDPSIPVGEGCRPFCDYLNIGHGESEHVDPPLTKLQPLGSMALTPDLVASVVAPNPVIAKATIKFRPITGGDMNLSVYDARGALITTVARPTVAAVDNAFDLDAGNIASGTYHYSITLGATVISTGAFTVSR
ncbi:MAG: T9SS type A sorting domain-containing protein [Bacteroidota bacterium]